MVCACIATILLVLYIFFDVNYFIRVGVTIALSRLFQKKKKIVDVTTTYGICTTQDVDLFLKNMNNVRYLRELDFARFHYYDITGLYSAISKRGGGTVQGATSIRYRRFVSMLMPYKVTTKLIYWEGKNFYLEHEIISLSDNFVRAVILSKQTVTGANVPIAEILAELEPNLQLPEPSKDLEYWMNSMAESSQRYRKRD